MNSLSVAFALFFIFFSIEKQIQTTEIQTELKAKVNLLEKKNLSFLEKKVKKEYGALWTNKSPKIKLPPRFIFNSQLELSQYQKKLDLRTHPRYPECVLQRDALENLLLAEKEALNNRIKISPRGKDSCLRSYQKTLELWLSRVEPNLEYYLKNHKISKEEALLIKNAKTKKQVELILSLEKERNLLFDKYRKTSILRSVAAPGTSQHLSGLAFDLKEYNNPKTRKIMNKFGWYQTVIDDIPHFTYLAFNPEFAPEQYELVKVLKNNFEYWILKS